MQVSRRALLAGTALTLVCRGRTFAAAPDAESWPQFLGPRRNGRSPATSLLDSWPAGGPPLLWKTQSGPGMSGLAIMGERIFTLGEAQGEQCLIALARDNGAKLWSTPLAPAYENAMGNGPRSTPTLHQGVAYVFTGEGVLAAVSAEDGKLIWRNNAVRTTQGKTADYGMACSPLIVGDTAVVSLGAPGPSLAAFSLTSGELQWSLGTDAAGYSSPILATFHGQQQIIALTGDAVLAATPKGQQLWRQPFPTEYGCNTACAVAANDHLLISAGENHGAMWLKISDQGPQEIWSSLGAASTLRCEWQTPVIEGDAIYGLDNVGSAGPITHLTCVNLGDGTPRWRKARFGKANFTEADGKLWCSTTEGDLVVVKMSPDSYQEIGRQRYVGFTRQAPVVLQGRLYLKDDSGSIACLNVSRNT